MTWRDGVHITGTSIWCDARRMRDVCFVSSADAVPSARHGQLVATDVTLRLLSRRGKSARPQTELPVPFGRPFNLGTRRIELFRSGHAIGAASLAVDVDGRRVVYAGPVNPAGGGLGGAADHRVCDTLVLTATYGDPRFAFPPVEEVAAEVVAYCRSVSERGGAATLLLRSPLKGLDVGARLAADGLRVTAHRAIHHAARRLEGSTPAPSPLRRFGGKARGGEVLLWLFRARDALDRIHLPPGSGVALLSGSALEREAASQLRAEVAFPWSNQADHAALIRYVEASGASRVYFTGRHGEALARALDRPGRAAGTLGPPRQMRLF